MSNQPPLDQVTQIGPYVSARRLAQQLKEKDELAARYREQMQQAFGMKAIEYKDIKGEYTACFAHVRCVFEPAGTETFELYGKGPTQARAMISLFELAKFAHLLRATELEPRMQSAYFHDPKAPNEFRRVYRIVPPAV